MGTCTSIRFIVAIAAITCAIGCAQPAKIRTIETQLPIYIQPQPPPELLAPIALPLPQFTSAANGVVGLDEANAVKLTQLLQELTARLRAWREWATAKR